MGVVNKTTNWWVWLTNCPNWHPKSNPQVVAEVTRFTIPQSRLKLLALCKGRGQLGVLTTPTTNLVVKVAVYRHLWFSLPLEESVMEFLIVDCEFPEFWTDPLSRPLLQTLSIFLLFQCRSHLHYTSSLEERERERGREGERRERERGREKGIHLTCITFVYVCQS